MFLFDSFYLDVANASLRNGEQPIALTPKAFATLRYLIEHAGDLVTKDELWRAIWPGVVVTDAALTVCVSEIRKALGDNARSPRFVETVHRRGYRFITPVKTQTNWQPESKIVGDRIDSAELPSPPFVGRKEELALLRKWFGMAAKGERQIVFVTGEPGIGKSAIVEMLLRRYGVDREALVGRGQCIEHYGAGEPYLPILEALGRICRGPEGKKLVRILDQYAPTWLVQMSALVSPDRLDALQRKTAGATRQRMLRELTEAVEVIATHIPVVLCIEDMHWCDYSTLDWLAFLGRRREPARLLVLGTYRPVDAIQQDHPLIPVKQELQIHGQCRELALGLFGDSVVAEYLTERFASPAISQAMIDVAPSMSRQTFAHAIHSRTGGNPFFIKNLVDYLIARKVVVRVNNRWEFDGDLRLVGTGMPAGPQRLIAQQLVRVNPTDRYLLEAASVAGMEFSAATVATALEKPIEEIEQRCETFSQTERFLCSRGVWEWPEKTVVGCYGFVHSLYREVIYAQIATGRRTDLHRKIAECEERAYGSRASEVAAELAVHFERGRDDDRAAEYRRIAGQNAVRRSANTEALGHFRKGLENLGRLPDSVERSRAELTLQLSLGPLLIAASGSASVEVERSYARAQELCDKLDDGTQLFPVLFGLRSLSLARSDLRKAHEFGEQLLELAKRQEDSDLLLEAHLALGNTWFQLGEPAFSRKEFDQGLAVYDPSRHRSHAFTYGLEPGMFCHSLVAIALQLLGYPDQARKHSRKARIVEEECPHPHSLATASNFAAWFYQLCGDAESTQNTAENAIAVCSEHGFPSSQTLGNIRRGWSLVRQGEGKEGFAQIRDGLDTWKDTGAQLGRPYFLALLADACRELGQTELGLKAVAEALHDVHLFGERWVEADLYRVKGELTLQFQDSHRRSQVEREAEAYFRKALDVARQQRAKFWELRSAICLSRLLKQQNKCAEAHDLLYETYSWFTEGFDTKYLKEAKALLVALEH